MKKIGTLLMCCILLSGCGSKRGDGREQLKLALGLKTLPASVRNIHFEEVRWTDHIINVYFELDPADFPALLAGRPLVRKKKDPMRDRDLTRYRFQTPSNRSLFSPLRRPTLGRVLVVHFSNNVG